MKLKFVQKVDPINKNGILRRLYSSADQVMPAKLKNTMQNAGSLTQDGAADLMELAAG